MASVPQRTTEVRRAYLRVDRSTFLPTDRYRRLSDRDPCRSRPDLRPTYPDLCQRDRDPCPDASCSKLRQFAVCPSDVAIHRQVIAIGPVIDRDLARERSRSVTGGIAIRPGAIRVSPARDCDRSGSDPNLSGHGPRSGQKRSRSLTEGAGSVGRRSRSVRQGLASTTY
jgi:hypothetical protein